MRILEKCEVELCTACALLLANGTVGDYGTNPRPDLTTDDDHLYERPDDDCTDNADTRHAALIDARWPADKDGWWELGSNAGEELFFSWQQCDGCGSRLGGDRMDGYAVKVADR